MIKHYALNATDGIYIPSISKINGKYIVRVAVYQHIGIPLINMLPQSGISSEKAIKTDVRIRNEIS